MVRLPKSVAEDDLSNYLQSVGLKRVHQGKVRDTYALPFDPDLLLVVATDRISIFDIVLPATVKVKGEILTAMTVFWLTGLLCNFKHHLVAYGSAVNAYLPGEVHDLEELQKRALVVEKLTIRPIESIVRGYLTGSGWKDYQATGMVCGHMLPKGLHDGSKLPNPIYTPSSKAEAGHDVNLSVDEVRLKYGMAQEQLALAIYQKARDYAEQQGIIIADTKFEFGEDDTLADEVLTPDSSRFWTAGGWSLAAQERKSPDSFDKQPVRNWGLTVTTPFGGSIKQLDPSDQIHLDWVENCLDVPAEICALTMLRYVEIFKRLTGKELADFQHEDMAIG